jgi:hypothetical protein
VSNKATSARRNQILSELLTLHATPPSHERDVKIEALQAEYRRVTVALRLRDERKAYEAAKRARRFL